jgi:hypothetical protein
MKKKQIDEAIAKLHLEKGDALVLDASVFKVDDFRMATVPSQVRLFCVLPHVGKTVRDAFCILHAQEIERLTKDKLESLIKLFGLHDEFLLSIVDGIERDFCRCDEESVAQQKRQDEDGFVRCAIHERCAVLKDRLKKQEKESYAAD